MISAIVLTKNEEKNISDCLRSIRWADEIIVVDSGSSDMTVELAKNFGAKTFIRNFTNYSDQRNYAIKQCAGEWIFFLDADERVDADFESEVRKIEREDGDLICAYTVDRLEYFMGDFIRHGGFGRGKYNHHVRLWRAGKLRFEGRVHEKAVVQGVVGRLSSAVEHYSNEGNVSGFILKLNSYTNTEVEEELQDVELGFSDLVIKPALKFIYRYIWLRGYRDGARGLVYFVLLAFYDVVSCAKKIEKMKTR